VTHPRTDRVTTLLLEAARLDPVPLIGARRAVLRARDDLSRMLRTGQPADVVQAYRYRVDRAVDVLREEQRRQARHARVLPA
jgi:hypothetical protein